MTKPSYAHGATDVPLLGETIGQNLRRTVERWPESEALVVPFQNYRATYRQFWEQTGLVARGLMARGVKKGDRVGIWSANRYEWVVLQYASARMGAILVNINPAYRTHELEYVLKQSGVSLLVASKGFRHTNYIEMIREVEEHCPEHKATLIIDQEWGTLMEDGKRVSEDELRTREASLQFDDPINIQYTSGTTGFPKGATLSHHNILNNGFFIGERLAYTEKDRACLPVPFYHCFGMVLGNMAVTTHGACIVVPGEAFDPGVVLKVVQEEKCTALYGVPTMFIAEFDHPDFKTTDFSSLRTGIMAGSPCPVEAMKRVQQDMNMTEVTICYGMTETSPVSAQSRVDDPLDKRVSTVGSIHPHVEVKIIDPSNGRILPRGGDRRNLHPGLLGDAGLLGGHPLHPPVHRRRALDAHRRSGDHGR